MTERNIPASEQYLPNLKIILQLIKTHVSLFVSTQIVKCLINNLL
jgi:hypothetical protein